MTESLALLFILFFKIGAFSFGGGLAMLPVIFQTISEHGLMTAGEFANLVAISLLLATLPTSGETTTMSSLLSPCLVK